MPQTREPSRLTRDARILAAVDRCANVRPCVLQGFRVEDGQIVIELYMLAQHDEKGRLVRPSETCRLAIPVRYGRSSVRAL